MDFGAIGENLPFIIGVVVLILLQLFFRKRRPATSNREIAQSLLSEVRLNLALVETFSLRQKPKKLEVTSWRRSMTKLDFLDQPLQTALSDAFALAEDLNQQIDVAKKHRTANYTASIRVDKIKMSLEKSKQGLEQWLSTSAGGKEPPPKYSGIFDDFLAKKD